MRYLFLGTGTSQGIPIIGCDCRVCQSPDPRDKRLRTAFYLESASTKIAVDAGPDFRQQFLQNGLYDVDAILITHEHQDHTAGLDEVRAINFLQHKTIPVYGSASALARLREQYSYIFTQPDYPGIPRIELRELPNHTFSIGDIEITPIDLLHMKLPVKGFRFGEFTYITDANSISESEKAKVAGSKYLVLNALRQTQHHSHFSLNEAVALADELGVEKAWFTHISHQMGRHAEVGENLKPGRYLAWDGLEISTEP